jgi:hypothetical protein
MPHAHWIYLDLPESDQAFRAMAGFFESHLPRDQVLSRGRVMSRE